MTLQNTIDPIRVYVCMLGMDQHENGAIAVSRILRDDGMEVIYGGKFNTVDTIIRACEQEDIDIIGVSAHSWEYRQFVPEIIEQIGIRGLDSKLVIGGSILTLQDTVELKEMGVAGTFPAGTDDQELLKTIRHILKLRTHEKLSEGN